MGNATSADLDSRRCEWHIPSWCVGREEVIITDEMSRLVQESWARVMHDDNAAFKMAHVNDPSLTPLTFFYDAFYSHLFTWLPECKPMFKRGIRQQGRMLANVIKFIVENLTKNDGEFKANLTMLAKVHNGRGITANHYSVMGMTLLHTIRVCIGDDYFTPAHRHAWVVVYSRMMIVMIPVVVSGETVDTDYMDDKAVADRAKAASKAANRIRWAWRETSDELAECPMSKQKGEAGKCPAAMSSGRSQTDGKIASKTIQPVRVSTTSSTSSHLGGGLSSPSNRPKLEKSFNSSEAGQDSPHQLNMAEESPPRTTRHVI